MFLMKLEEVIVQVFSWKLQYGIQSLSLFARVPFTEVEVNSTKSVTEQWAKEVNIHHFTTR